MTITTDYRRLKELLRLVSFSSYVIPLTAALLSALCAMGLIGAAAWLIATAALQPPLAALTLGITAVRACGIGRAAFRYFERWLSHRLAFHCYTELQLHLYDIAARLLPLRSGAIAQGSFLQTLTTGCATLRDFYLRCLFPPVTVLLLALAGCAALFPFCPAAASLFLLIPIPHLLLPLIFDRTAPDEKEQSVYRSALLDLAAGQDELRAGGNRPEVLLRLNRQASAFGCCQLARQRRLSRTDFFLQIFDAGFFLFFFLLLCQAVLSGSLSFIGCGVWPMLGTAFLTELRSTAPAMRQWHLTRKALQRMAPLPAPPLPQAEEPPSLSAPLLAVKDLGFSYQPGVPVLQHLSFTIHAGQHTAIVGESGCGKTTLAGLLTAFWAPDSGKILVQGRDTANMTADCIRSFFGSSLQGSFIFPWSIRDCFTRLHPGISEEQIHFFLHLANLDNLIEHLPQGIETPPGENGSHLSGGQRNRLLTALALASQAPILLLDEPTAGLDQKTAAIMMNRILLYLDRQKQTLLLITHDPLALSRVQQVIRLR